MKYLTLTLFILGTLRLTAQKPDSEALLKEGKLLYRLEKAAWFSTDHFLEHFSNKRDSIGGYLSYEGTDGNVYSIFFSRYDNFRILARYQFANLPTPTPNSVETENNSPVGQEADLISIRQNTLNMISSNTDGFFTFYENTSFNPIPIINGSDRKVYVLTASQKQGSVFIGNDYLLEYNSKNELTKKVKLHNSLIELPYKAPNGQKVTATMHTHILSNHIEVTDICTLLLYKDYVDWTQHYAINIEYISILDLEKENLVIMTKKAFDKIRK
ncbi:MAG: hypothetical protein RIF34_04925 [Candidatus Kapaibacterium sp.]